MRSMHSSEQIEQLVTDLEAYRWDAILMNETWRHEPAEIWETHHKPLFMGSGKFDNKHGVGKMLNKWWRQRIIDPEYINESKYADHHIEKMYKTIEKHMTNCNRYIPIIRGDFNAEVGPGNGTECKSVDRYPVNEGNKRGDWLKSWLMLQDYTALNTISRKTPLKQTTFTSPKGNEKQIYKILKKRRYLKHIKDAEANDMIHMGSDHRGVMATFTISMRGKNSNHKNMKGKHDKKKHERSTLAEKTSVLK